MSKKPGFDRHDVRTTLAPGDRERFTQLCTTRGINQTELARQAIVFYLDHSSGPYEQALEAEYIKAVKKATNRICALVAKVAIDTRAIYRFLGELEGDPQRMIECRNRASVQITRVLNDGERRVADELSQAARANDGNNPQA